MFLSLDEWRTENTSAAEILLQPQTGRLLSNFEAVDGGHPGIGYSLLYNPDIPEEYDGRIRIILKNRIRPRSSLGAFRGVLPNKIYSPLAVILQREEHRSHYMVGMALVLW